MTVSCPKQIRYYDRNGNADLDIDLHHGDEKGKATFPHKHTWSGFDRSKAITKGLEKVWEYWQCKNYDYKNKVFRDLENLKKEL